MAFVLVTGATGYVGGRLVPRLLRNGHRVRCLVRDSGRLKVREWWSDVEVVEGDIRDPGDVRRSVAGVDVAYYLVHSLGRGVDFAEQDRLAARLFSAACENADVDRIVYLGGLKPKGDAISEHLLSRLETGEELRSSGVPVTEFRAGIIIGSGSYSFELVRYLTERIPVLISPRWVTTLTQPIAIRDVLSYLMAALTIDSAANLTFDIGGPDVLSYGGLMKTYARARGLRRWVIRVPVLTPRLSSHWIGLVTPLPARTARPLIDGLKNEMVCDESTTAGFFTIRPIGVEQAMQLALDRYDKTDVEATWFGSYSSSAGQPPRSTLSDVQGMMVDSRERDVRAPVDDVFSVVSRLGGERGWLFATFLWKIRGAMDQFIGGVGFRRGRRHPTELNIGEAVDFWRVEALDPGRRIRLRAEMKMPGRAWLQFDTLPLEGGVTRVIQTVFFEPRGLAGLSYWCALFPFHALIFSGMLRAIGRLAEQETGPKGAVGSSP